MDTAPAPPPAPKPPGTRAGSPLRWHRGCFWAAVRPHLGRLTASQVQGGEALLAAMEADPELTDQRYAAYYLATAWHETARTLRPVEEIGRGRGRPYGTPDPRTGHTYYGRGYVQLTWKRNYALAGRALGVDLVTYPDLALRPDLAYLCLARGLTRGWYGHRLDQHLRPGVADYVRARQSVNGMDRAGDVAAHARAFEAALRIARLHPETPSAAS